MDKKIAGKYAGLVGIVTLIITVLCQVTHNGGIPWKNIGKAFTKDKFITIHRFLGWNLKVLKDDSAF